MKKDPEVQLKIEQALDDKKELSVLVKEFSNDLDILLTNVLSNNKDDKDNKDVFNNLIKSEKELGALIKIIKTFINSDNYFQQLAERLLENPTVFGQLIKNKNSFSLIIQQFPYDIAEQLLSAVLENKELRSRLIPDFTSLHVVMKSFPPYEDKLIKCLKGSQYLLINTADLMHIKKEKEFKKFEDLLSVVLENVERRQHLIKNLYNLMFLMKKLPENLDLLFMTLFSDDDDKDSRDFERLIKDYEDLEELITTIAPSKPRLEQLIDYILSDPEVVERLITNNHELSALAKQFSNKEVLKLPTITDVLTAIKKTTHSPIPDITKHYKETLGKEKTLSKDEVPHITFK